MYTEEKAQSTQPNRKQSTAEFLHARETCRIIPHLRSSKRAGRILLRLMSGLSSHPERLQRNAQAARTQHMPRNSVRPIVEWIRQNLAPPHPTPRLCNPHLASLGSIKPNYNRTLYSHITPRPALSCLGLYKSLTGACRSSISRQKY
jgi:hypothetical protein